MITQDLFDKINDALSDRSDWERRQTDWYNLRYDGYPRPTLPYPGAPDMHYPLVDIEIEKLKPFYIQQVYAQERLASFIDASTGANAAVQQSNELVAKDEIAFDCELKQRSNFDEAAHVLVDKMLHYGICVVKTMWDKENERIAFATIDGCHIIVPPHTASIKTTEWLVHIIRLSEFQYRCSKKFIKNEEVIKKIKGSGQPGAADQEQQAIDVREGITGSKYDDSIILWEVYHKKPGDQEWTVSTVSPLAGVDTEVCADFKLPYNVGCFPNELPFTAFTYEKPTQGFYSPRGIAEILEPFELALCKNWNYQLQFLDFNGQPTFYIDDPMASMVNFSNDPGSTRPFGIKRDEPLNAPLDLMQQMSMTRALAEDRVQMPDLGNSQHLTGKEGQKGEVTATQIRAIVGLSAQNNDLRSRIFKGDLANLYRQANDIRCQYRKIESKPVLIVPCGTSDSWNKENRAQKMLALFQVFQGRPNVDQDELVKLVFEQDSPELVQRLFRDSATATSDEAEKQANEFVLMINGFTPQTRPDDDDFTHLQSLAQFVERRLKRGEPVDPELAMRVLSHGAMHEQQMKQKKDPRQQQLNQQLAPVLAILTQIAQHGPPPPEPQQGAPAMPQQPQGQGQPQGQKPVSESISIKLADLTPDERAQALAMAGIRATPGASSAPPPKPMPQ